MNRAARRAEQAKAIKKYGSNRSRPFRALNPKVSESIRNGYVKINSFLDRFKA